MEQHHIVLTGATGGLGSRILQVAAERGHRVLIIARDLEKTLALLDEVVSRNKNFEAEWFIADLRSQEWASELKGYFNQGDFAPSALVNNAAINTPLGKAWELDLQKSKEHFEINFFSPVKLISLIIPLLIKRGRGSIINISGGGATKPLPYFSPYSASKAALIRFTETIAHELAEERISVNSVAPGFLATDIHASSLIHNSPLPKEIKTQIKDQYASGGESPDKAANLIMKLIENDNHLFTGNLLSAIWDNLNDDDFERNTLVDSRFKLRRIE